MVDPTTKQKRQTAAYIISCLLMILIVSSIAAKPNIALAQVSTASYTPSPYTPSITPTPSNTPTTIPTADAAVSDREVITVDNASRIQKYRAWQAHNFSTLGVAFIPGTDYLVSVADEMGADHSQPIRLWNIQENGVRPIDHFFEGVPIFMVGAANKLSVSTDGTRVIARAEGFEVWDAKTGKLMGRVLEAADLSAAVLDSTHQELFVAGNNVPFIGVWNIPSYVPFTNSEMGPAPTDFVFNPQGILIRTLPVDESVIQLAYDDDSRQLFALTITGRLLIYTFADFGAYTMTTAPQAAAPKSNDIVAPEGSRKLILDTQNHRLTYLDSYWNLVVYDYVQNKIVTTYPLGRPTNCLTYSPDKQLMVITDWAYIMKLEVIDMITQKTLAQIVTGEDIWDCDFSWDGKWIATADNDGQIELWGVPAR